MKGIMAGITLVLLAAALLVGCSDRSGASPPSETPAAKADGGKGAAEHQGHGAPAAPGQKEQAAAEPPKPSRETILDAIRKRLGLGGKSGEHQQHEGQAAGGMAGMEPDSVMLTPQKRQLSGVRTGLVEIRDLDATIRTVGIVDYDERKLARIHTKFEGWIEELFVNFTGEYVKRGDRLFTVYSPELVATQAEYLLALKATRHLEGSPVPEVARSGPSLLEAARRRLQLWDITDDQIRKLEETGTPQRTLTFYSPIDGIVLKKDAFKGMFIKPETETYQIADISTVWVNADIYEYELPLIREGQEATVSLSYLPGQVFKGRVVYIYPYLQEKSRTIRARFELRNSSDWKLKPGMFSNVEVKIGLGRRLAIPEEAVLDSGTRRVVFVDKGEGRFDPRDVKLGTKVEGYYEVLSGVSNGEKVVTSANFLIDSESQLKGAMGGMAGH